MPLGWRVEPNIEYSDSGRTVEALYYRKVKSRTFLNFGTSWRTEELHASASAFTASNLAFDRGVLDDRIVDLVIAAESLFLGELDEQYRGELRFRFALRAAKFIEHPSYGEHDVFRVMRRAYDARSAIVHGGSPKDTRLPDRAVIA